MVERTHAQQPMRGDIVLEVRRVQSKQTVTVVFSYGTVIEVGTKRCRSHSGPHLEMYD